MALLFLADRYLPGQIAASAHADVDKSVIRINSGHKWPEAVVYDTSLPTIVPVVAAADISSERPLREAFAQLPSPPPTAREPAAETLPKATPVKRKARAYPPVRRVANYRPVESQGVFRLGW